jgi:D-serine deaminase-like pyridoxal phosphate-dependent protein
MNLLTDDADTVQSLDDAAGKAGVTYDVFVKIDCGTHRVGVELHTPEAVQIPRLISDAKNLDFAGILTHAGHSYEAKTKEGILDVARHERDSMVELAERLRDNEHRSADDQHRLDADYVDYRPPRRH